MSRQDELAELQRVLTDRRDSLQGRLAGDLSLLRELAADAADDVAFAAIESDSQLADVEASELKKIGAALGQCRAGKYGICEVCGTNISIARLTALPYATKCICCQRQAEREAEG
jgi:DnaK suppressor protein